MATNLKDLKTAFWSEGNLLGALEARVGVQGAVLSSTDPEAALILADAVERKHPLADRVQEPIPWRD
jgi:hypothetical protein